MLRELCFFFGPVTFGTSIVVNFHLSLKRVFAPRGEVIFCTHLIGYTLFHIDFLSLG